MERRRAICVSVLLALSIPAGHAVAWSSRGGETPDQSKMPAAQCNTEYYPVYCTVLDSLTGDTLAARCSVTDCNDFPRHPPQSACLYHSAGKGYFYADGVFTVVVPGGATVFRVGHGFEYYPIVRTVVVSGDTTLAFHLRRIVDMAALGWYSGDCHMHINHAGGIYTLVPRHAHFMARAEGLNIVHCLDNAYFFTGAPDPSSTNDCIVYMTEENRSSSYGHMGLLGLTELVSPFSSIWYPMTADVADSVHAGSGALVIAAHPVSSEDFFDVDAWPGNGLARELPVDVIGGKIDGFELLSYSNCSPAGIELELWYRLLNCGFRLSACAGSDACMNRLNDQPLGGFRTYVRVPAGDFGSGSWLGQLGCGRSFVSNMPLITHFELGGLEPGDTLACPKGEWELAGRLSAVCAYPLDGARIVQNGNIVRSLVFRGGLSAFDTTFTIVADRSSWIAAYVYGKSEHWMPVGDTLFAHTGPLHVIMDGVPPVCRRDAGFFVGWIDDLISLTRERGYWQAPSDSARVLAAFESARGFYQERAAVVSPVEQPLAGRGAPEPLVLSSEPNPFSTAVLIRFGVEPFGAPERYAAAAVQPSSLPAELVVHDVCGRFVRRLFGGDIEHDGYTVYWDGTDERGRQAASGVYFCTFRAGSFCRSRKLLLVR